MKKVLLAMGLSIVFAAGIVSETRYTNSANATTSITNNGTGKYVLQGDSAFYVSFTGAVPTQSWSVPTGSIFYSHDSVANGYVIKIYSALTTNVVVGKSSI